MEPKLHALRLQRGYKKAISWKRPDKIEERIKELLKGMEETDAAEDLEHGDGPGTGSGRASPS